MIPITHVGLRAMTGIKQQQQQKVTSTTHKRFNNTPENNESVPTVYPSLNRLRAKADNLIGQYKDGLEGKATLMELKYQSGMLKKTKKKQNVFSSYQSGQQIETSGGTVFVPCKLRRRSIINCVTVSVLVTQSAYFNSHCTTTTVPNPPRSTGTPEPATEPPSGYQSSKQVNNLISGHCTTISVPKKTSIDTDDETSNCTAVLIPTTPAGQRSTKCQE